MASTADDGPSPPEGVVATLGIRQAARRAVTTGAAVAIGVLVLFVGLLAGGEPTQPAPLYALLAFVVFATTASIAMAIIVGRRVLRLAVHPASIVRWGAAVGLVAGLLWSLAALSVLLGPGGPWGALVDVSLPWAAVASPLGVWAVYTRIKRVNPTPRLAAGAALLAVAGALVVADLAAFEVLALLPDAGGPVNPAARRLFLAGALGLTGGQVVLAGLGASGDHRHTVVLALWVAPVAGMIGFLLLEPGRFGLAAVTAGQGASWIVVGWQLRRVGDLDVPTGPSTGVDAV